MSRAAVVVNPTKLADDETFVRYSSANSMPS